MSDLRQLITAEVRDTARNALPESIRGRWGEAGLGALIGNAVVGIPAEYAPKGFEALADVSGQVIITATDVDVTPLIVALADTPLRIRADQALATGEIAWDVRLRISSWRDQPDESGLIAMLTFDIDGGLVRRIDDVALNETNIGKAPNTGAGHEADYQKVAA